MLGYPLSADEERMENGGHGGILESIKVKSKRSTVIFTWVNYPFDVFMSVSAGDACAQSLYGDNGGLPETWPLFFGGRGRSHQPERGRPDPQQY